MIQLAETQRHTHTQVTSIFPFAPADLKENWMKPDTEAEQFP